MLFRSGDTASSQSGSSQCSFIIITDDIPSGGDLSFKVVSGTSSSVSATTTQEYINELSCIMVVDGEEAASYAIITAINPNNYSLLFEMKDTPMGTKGGKGGKGFLKTNELSANWNWDWSSNTWGVGSSGNLDFNDLLTQQVLSLQLTPKLMYSGALLKDTTDIDFLDTIKNGYDGDTYKMIANRVTYSDDELEGDWITISKDTTDITFDDVEIKNNNTIITNTITTKQQNILNENTGDIDTGGGNISTNQGNIDTEDADGIKGNANVGNLNADGNINLANLPTSDAGLNAGDLFIGEDGFIKIKI